MPAVIALTGLVFNALNAYLNARWISHFATYETSWFTTPAFVAGATLFVLGMGLNIHSDNTLIRLRSPGETTYKIPRGGMYRLVSCPNYLGEILEWAGWALATWSTAGLAFAFYTAANLVPRALTHHKWYRNKFPNYPPERRAVLPFLL
jgi:steroid 5-alpha reductase family enzyme